MARRRVEGRRQSERHRGGEDDGRGEEEHAPVRGHLDPVRHVQRRGAQERWYRGRTEDEPEPGPQQPEHQRLGQELSQDAAAVGAESRANGELAPPAGGARQQQVHDRRAGHRQQQEHGAEQADEGGRVFAGQAVAQRHQGDPQVARFRRKLPADAFEDPGDLRQRLLAAHAGGQASDRGQEMVRALGLMRRERHRSPQLAVLREAEAGGHNPDHRPRLAAHLDALPENGTVATEAALPQAVAQEDGVFPARPILLRHEVAAQLRRYAEDREEVPAHPGSVYPLRLPAAGQCEAAVEVGAHAP